MIVERLSSPHPPSATHSHPAPSRRSDPPSQSLFTGYLVPLTAPVTSSGPYPFIYRKLSTYHVTFVLFKFWFFQARMTY